MDTTGFPVNQFRVVDYLIKKLDFGRPDGGGSWLFRDPNDGWWATEHVNVELVCGTGAATWLTRNEVTDPLGGAVFPDVPLEVVQSFTVSNTQPQKICDQPKPAHVIYVKSPGLVDHERLGLFLNPGVAICINNHRFYQGVGCNRPDSLTNLEFKCDPNKP